MGLINPIATRVNQYLPWRTRVYRSGKGSAASSQSPLPNQLIADKVLKHIFQYALISQPWYQYSTRGVTILLYSYQTQFHQEHFPITSLDKNRVERILGQVLASQGQPIKNSPLRRITLDKDIVCTSNFFINETLICLHPMIIFQ